MSFSVKTIDVFERQAKRLIKKFPSLKLEIASIVTQLEKNPEIGTAIGLGCYKIRISIASKGKGKSGGARLITHIIIKQSTVYLMNIYDKSERENLSTTELKELIKNLG